MDEDTVEIREERVVESTVELVVGMTDKLVVGIRDGAVVVITFESTAVDRYGCDETVASVLVNDPVNTAIDVPKDVDVDPEVAVDDMDGRSPMTRPSLAVVVLPSIGAVTL